MRTYSRRRLKKWAIKARKKQRGGFIGIAAGLAALAPYLTAAATGAATTAGAHGMSKLLNRRPKAERIKLRQARKSRRIAKRTARRR